MTSRRVPATVPASPPVDAPIIVLLERIATAVEALAKSRESTPPDVLTAPQLADLLQVDLRTLREMRRADEVPRGFMCGRSPRWKRTQIEAWMANKDATNARTPRSTKRD